MQWFSISWNFNGKFDSSLGNLSRDVKIWKVYEIILIHSVLECSNEPIFIQKLKIEVDEW